jgi:hypothetical protein
MASPLGRRQQPKRLRVGLAFVESGQGLTKAGLGRRHLGKQREARSELHRIDRAQHVRGAALRVRQQRLDALDQPGTQHRVRRVGGRFVAARHAVLPRHGAAPQLTKLREHVPDPVRPLLACAQLGQGGGVGGPGRR